METILARIVRRARALLASGHEPDLDEEDELALAQTCAASLRTEGTQTQGPDEVPDVPLGVVLLPTRRKARIERCRSEHGDRDAEVCVQEHERERLEHVALYLLRPPIALGRLKLLGPNIVCLELKRPWSDRTTHVTMSPSVFLGRLASLVPRPRANTTLFIGVLAAHSKDRASITPKRRTQHHRHEDASWAALMKYSFDR